MILILKNIQTKERIAGADITNMIINFILLIKQSLLKNIP